MYKVIACGIFKPYIEHLHLNKQDYDFTFLKVQQHNQPQKLSKAIQTEINESRNYDKIIILYGLCGGALLPIQARDIPLIVIRVHDCMSVLLGSKERYEELTLYNKSLNWTCYSLKQENYVNESVSKWEEFYDEETVEYLKSILIPQRDMYISFHLEEEQEYEEEETNIVQGDLSFLNNILSFKSKDILFVYPTQMIKQTYDQDVIEVINVF